MSRIVFPPVHPSSFRSRPDRLAHEQGDALPGVADEEEERVVAQAKWRRPEPRSGSIERATDRTLQNLEPCSVRRGNYLASGPSAQGTPDADVDALAHEAGRAVSH